MKTLMALLILTTLSANADQMINCERFRNIMRSKGAFVQLEMKAIHAETHEVKTNVNGSLRLLMRFPEMDAQCVGDEQGSEFSLGTAVQIQNFDNQEIHVSASLDIDRSFIEFVNRGGMDIVNADVGQIALDEKDVEVLFNAIGFTDFKFEFTFPFNGQRREGILADVIGSHQFFPFRDVVSLPPRFGKHLGTADREGVRYEFTIASTSMMFLD